MKFLFLIMMATTSSSLLNAKEAAADFSLKVRPCDNKTPTSLEFFVERKAYANESIRVFSVDTLGEPACCSSHVVIYMPEKDASMSNKCFHLASDDQGRGFSEVNLSKAKGSYNSKNGLSLEFPVKFYNPEGDGFSKTFTILINQEKQSVVIK